MRSLARFAVCLFLFRLLLGIAQGAEQHIHGSPGSEEGRGLSIHANSIGDSKSKVRIAERILEMLRQGPASYVSRFPVRVGSRIQLVFTEDIEWIAGAGNYAELHTQGRCHLLRETLNSLEQKLDPSQFLRIHRSRIVRARCVRELQPIDNREYLVKLSDGSEHRSSRTYADRLDDWLSSRRP
jgi:two-component system LytT family response regulator